MRISFVFFLAMIVNAATARAAEDEWRFLLQAIKNQRAEIRAGHFVGSGTLESRDDEYGILKGEIKLSAFCDFEAHKLRFDYEEPIRKYDGKDDVKWIVGRGGGQFIRTEKNINTRRMGGDRIQIQSPETPNPAWCAPFDVRALGLLFWPDYASGTPFAQVWENYSRIDKNEVTHGDHGLVTVVTMMSPAMRRTLVVDTERGYWPLKLIVEHRTRAEDGNLIWANPPDLVSEVSVKKVQGIWLPVRYLIRTSTIEHRLEISWKSVNETIDPIVFTMKGLDTSKAQMAVDTTLDQPVVVERFNTLEASRNDMHRAKRYYWLIAANVVIVSVLLVLFMRRLYSRKHSSL